MYRISSLRSPRPYLGLLLLLTASPAIANEIELFATMLTGEFNNQAQVQQQDSDESERPRHTHTSYTPVAMHEGNARLFFVEERDGQNTQQVRSQQMFKLTQNGKSVLLRIYVPNNPRKVNKDKLSGWRPLGACDTRWQLKDGVFTGRLINVPSCRRVAADYGARVPAVKTGSLDKEYFDFTYEVYRNDRKLAGKHHTRARKVNQ